METLMRQSAMRDTTTVTKECQMHGPYTAFRWVDPITAEVYDSKCPKCTNEAEAEQKQKIIIEREDPQVKFRRRLMDAGVPLKFLDDSFDNFKVKGYDDPRHEARQEFIQFLDNSYSNLILAGPVGVGKTHLGCALVREALLWGRTAHIIKEGALLRQIKATFGRKDITEQDVIDRFARYHFLVIDEVGLSPWTEYNSQALTDIIDDRANNKVKTVYLGNMTSEDMARHFNDQCLSRIKTRYSMTNLVVEDYRGYL